MASNWRFTGLNSASVASVTDDGVLVAAPGSGKQIIVHDVSVEGATNLLDADGGTAILPFGKTASMNFTAGVPFGDNKGVWSSGNDITVIITYHIENV